MTGGSLAYAPPRAENIEGAMPILFCNVAWMDDYAGRDPNDPPLGGGGFPRAEGYCGEECNFLVGDDGMVYGHFEISKNGVDRQVKLERLGASRTDDYLDNVDIVWTAPLRGRDPRVVVGWYRGARLYRERQAFDEEFPSARHRKDQIGSYQVKARAADVVLIPPRDRDLQLRRGRGWSGQVSWWYAEDSTDPDAIAFLAAVRAKMDGEAVAPIHAQGNRRGRGGRGGRAGPAPSEPHRRYLRKFEVEVHPRHHELETRFKAYLRAKHARIEFPECYRDDLRYTVEGEVPVMVEVKPTDQGSQRYAIRTAIGQLLDYRQHQLWNGRQLIVVENPVDGTDDLALALDNGFGIAWPKGKKGFVIRWP
ncbi:hypothetical protein ACG3SL_19600 [Sphingomonas sp. CJ20]